MNSGLQVSQNQYSMRINGDQSVSFFDTFGTVLQDFSPNVPYLYIEFTKNPDPLTISAASTPEIPAGYHNSLSLPVISDLYKTRTDLAVQDRLMMAKSFDNDWKESLTAAKMDFKRRGTLIPTSMQVTEDFSNG